jgi:SAM-dependent methyltransferase
MIEMKNWVERVLTVVGPRGPYPHEYAATILAFSWLRKYVTNYKELVKELIIDRHEDYLAKEDPPARPYFNLILHIWYQPYGYAGDGDLLTKMYRALDTPDLDNGGEPLNPWVFSRWDSFIASRPEALAIQSRSGYVSSMAQFCAEKGMTSWLDVACGLGEFTKQVVTEQGDRIDRVTGLDNDPMSVDIAQKRNSAGLVNFQQMNALTDLPDGQYDAIYCTGLFDYLTDAQFVRLGKRFLTLKPRCIMIGNIQQGEATKALMDCLGWELFDRTRFDLVALGQQIVPGQRCEVSTDRTGMQHYLRIDVSQEGGDTDESVPTDEQRKDPVV